MFSLAFDKSRFLSFLFQAYYREGIAFQCLGKFSDALGAFSNGLALDPKNTQLLTGLVDAVSRSPLKSKLELKKPGACLVVILFVSNS